MTGIIDGLKDCSDSILGIRDQIGAALKPVYMVTRHWSGNAVGEGLATDLVVQILPSPRVVDFSHSLALKEGGKIEQGDIILRGISKHHYSELDVNCKSEASNVEKIYMLGDVLYNAISVTEKHLTWNVQIRRLSSQRKYESP